MFGDHRGFQGPALIDFASEYVTGNAINWHPLVRLVGNRFDDRTLINLFTSGLKLQTRVAVAAARPFRLADAYDIAMATGAAIESSLSRLNASLTNIV